MNTNDDALNLPTWMRQSQQIADWGVVIVFCLSLIIATPFILQADIPRNTALENQAYMAWSYTYALREGRAYPRWIEGALSGYGAPIGNYYPPATPYLIALTELFFTNDTVVAMRLVAISAILLCGVMTYLFMLRLMRAEYAIISALLYVYSPFIGQTVPYILGDLPLLIASALLPFSLWSMGRVVMCQNPLDRIVLALICALLWLTHIELAIATYILLITFLMMMTVIKRLSIWQIIGILSALVLGLGLSSFFWLSAWAEQDLVTWIRAPYNRLLPIITLENIIAPIHIIDLNQQIHIPQLGIGWAGMIFGILGCMGIFITRLYRRWLVFWLISGMIIMAIGIFISPTSLWLMSPFSLCLGIVGSGAYALSQRAPRHIQRLFLPALIVTLCLSSLPVWLAPRWSDEGDSWDTTSQIIHEQLGYGVAVLPPSRPIPITLPTPIIPNRGLINGYQNNNVVRIPQSQLTISKQAGLIASESHRDRYFIQTDTSAIFEVLRAYAPGWSANVDGRAISLIPNPATGLIQVVLARPTQGVLTISYESTPIRETAWAVSAGIGGFIVITIIVIIFRGKRPQQLIELELLPVQSARLMGVIIVGFIIFFAFFIMPQAPYSIYPPNGHQLIPFVAQNHKTDVGIEMLGYQVIAPQQTYHRGDAIRVQVAWRTARRLTNNYQVVVFLEAIDAPGLRWLQSEPRYLAGYPTRRWSLQKYSLDEYVIPVSNTLSQGDYRLVIELYRCQGSCLRENRVNFFTSDGEFIGSQVALSAQFHVQ
jgi:hypothetical protein